MGKFVINKPFTHYRCDICGGKIENLNDGLVVWDVDYDEIGNHFLKNCAIIHKGKCDHDVQQMSAELDYCVNNIGFWLERMVLYNGQTKAGMDGTWLTCMTRCMLPRFEQAMWYIKAYERDGYQFKPFESDCKSVLNWVREQEKMNKE